MSRSYPGSHTVTRDWLDQRTHSDAGFTDGTWAPARPLPYYGGFLRRLRLAYDVFRGRADALYWVRQ